MKILSLFFVAAGYFILTYFVSQVHVNVAVNRLPEQVLASRRLNQVHLIMIFLTAAITAPLEQQVYRPVAPESLLLDLNDQVKQFQGFQQGLLYGSKDYETYGSVKRSPVRDELNFGNACALLPFVEVNRIDEIDLAGVTCESLGSGVLLRGLDPALQFYLEQTRALGDQLAALPKDQNQTRVVEILNSPAVWQLEFLDRSYLRYGLLVDANLFLSEQLQANAEFMKVRAGLLGGFLVSIVFAYVLVFNPMIRALDRELKRVQAMLVMVPPDVMQGTAAMKNLLVSS